MVLSKCTRMEFDILRGKQNLEPIKDLEDLIINYEEMEVLLKTLMIVQ